MNKYSKHLLSIFSIAVLLSACSPYNIIIPGSDSLRQKSDPDVQVPSDNSSSRNIVTVGGQINVERGARIGGIATITGKVDIAGDTTINGDIRTEHGSVRMEQGGNVAGNILTISGKISLAQVSVAGTLETKDGQISVLNSKVHGINNVNGKIRVDNSTVQGDIRVKKPYWVLDAVDPLRRIFFPREIVIGENTHVTGDIVVEVDGVDVFVNESAVIEGQISGAKVISFSGKNHKIN